MSGHVLLPYIFRDMAKNALKRPLWYCIHYHSDNNSCRFVSTRLLSQICKRHTVAVIPICNPTFPMETMWSYIFNHTIAQNHTRVFVSSTLSVCRKYQDTDECILCYFYTSLDPWRLCRAAVRPIFPCLVVCANIVLFVVWQSKSRLTNHSSQVHKFNYV